MRFERPDQREQSQRLNVVTAAVQQLSLDPCGFLVSSSVHFKDMVRAKEELV